MASGRTFDYLVPSHDATRMTREPPVRTSRTMSSSREDSVMDRPLVRMLQGTRGALTFSALYMALSMPSRVSRCYPSLIRYGV
jgi:hypothetical protein